MGEKFAADDRPDTICSNDEVRLGARAPCKLGNAQRVVLARNAHALMAMMIGAFGKGVSELMENRVPRRERGRVWKALNHATVSV